eukprot:c37764_g1_i1 orf=3-158(-)
MSHRTNSLLGSLPSTLLTPTIDAPIASMSICSFSLYIKEKVLKFLSHAHDVQ